MRRACLLGSSRPGVVTRRLEIHSLVAPRPRGRGRGGPVMGESDLPIQRQTRLTFVKRMAVAAAVGVPTVKGLMSSPAAHAATHTHGANASSNLSGTQTRKIAK